MLNRVIRWFELEPVGTLLSYDPDAMAPFVKAGALTGPKRTRYADCRVCKASVPVQVYSWGEHLVRCARCGGQVDFDMEFHSVTAKLPWLADSLAAQIDASLQPAVNLIENRLWRLSEAASATTAVYLLRATLTLDVAPILTALNADFDDGRRLVITTSPFRDMPDPTAETTFVPLDEVAHMEPEGIRLQTRSLLPHLLNQAPLWFELPPPFNRLTLGGETLALRRRQPEFMRHLKLAHAAGQKKTSWRALLKRAGYPAVYTSLAQVFPNEIFRFIDTSKDDVWVRKVPLPKSRAGPEPHRSGQ